LYFIRITDIGIEGKEVMALKVKVVDSKITIMVEMSMPTPGTLTNITGVAEALVTVAVEMVEVVVAVPIHLTTMALMATTKKTVTSGEEILGATTIMDLEEEVLRRTVEATSEVSNATTIDMVILRKYECNLRRNCFFELSNFLIGILKRIKPAYLY
jgi:uncharacterized membrane protein